MGSSFGGSRIVSWWRAAVGCPHILGQGLHLHLRFASLLPTAMRSPFLLGVADILNELLVSTSPSRSRATPFLPYRVGGWRAFCGSGGGGSDSVYHGGAPAHAQVDGIGRQGLCSRWAWLTGGGRSQHQLGASQHQVLLLAAADQVLVLAGGHQDLLASLHWGEEDTVSGHLATTSG